MKKLLFFGVYLITCQILFAQVPETEWMKTYGGSGTESSSQVVENTDGDYFFACSSTSQPSEERTAPRKGSRDIWVVKTDKDGNKIWDKAYGAGQITVTGMAATADGGFIVGVNTTDGKGGDKSDTARGKLDIWLIKIDRNGNKVWDKTLGGSEGEGLGEIIEAPDGSILIAGSSRSTISGDKKSESFGLVDGWVVKLSRNGEYLWDKSFGGSGGDSFYTGLVDQEGNYLFGGTSFSPISGNKTDSSRGGNDGWLIKTDSDGNIIWDKTLGGDLTDYIQTMAETSDGDYVLGIVSPSSISGDKTTDRWGGDDCWLVKVNPSGNMIWQKTIGGSKSDLVLSVEIDNNDEIYLAFSTQSDISGDKTLPFIGPSSDIWIVKTNSIGNIAWQSSYEFAGLGTAKLTFDGSYVITGERNAIYIIKMKSVVNTSVINTKETGSLNIFPNPSVNQISLQIEKYQNVHSEIEIFDVEGKEILSEQILFVNGESHIVFDLNNGIYFIQIILGNKTYSQKFVVYK